MSHSSKANHKNVRLPFMVVCLALIVFGFYLSTAARSIAKFLPTFQNNVSHKASAQVNNSDDSDSEPNIYSPSGFTYDFSKMPDGRVSSKYWNFETGNLPANNNSEAQTYTRRIENVRIEDGALKIEARRENIEGRDYTSARINTRHKFEFTYGTLEVTMKLPRGGGTWPAAWLLPSKNVYNPSDYGISKNDPYVWAVNGEIDFMETIGGIENQNLPAAHSYNEFHRPPTHTPFYLNDAYNEYHTYGVIKAPNKITFTVDGQPYATHVRSSNSPLEWPFEQPYYLIINLALGGNWAGVGDIDPATNSWELNVQKINFRPM